MVPVIKNSTTQEEADSYLERESGTILKIVEDYEGNYAKLIKNAPPTAYYVQIRAGTSLFALYGADHVILKKD